MQLRKSYMLRVAVVNTHVNQGLRHGVVAFIRKRHPGVKIMLFQESHSEQALEEALPARWKHYPIRQPGEDTGKGGNEAGTYVAWDSKRFAFEGGINQDIGGSGKHAYPRRLTGAFLLDLKAHRVVFASSHHPDPLNPRDWSDANQAVKQRHIKQVADFVNWHHSKMDRGDEGVVGSHGGVSTRGEAIHLSGGDTNERIDLLQHPDSALNQFRAIGMLPTSRTAKRRIGNGRQGLMNLFTNQSMRTHQVEWHASYETGIAGMDHEVLVAGLRVPTQS